MKVLRSNGKAKQLKVIRIINYRSVIMDITKRLSVTNAKASAWDSLNDAQQAYYKGLEDIC